MTRRRKIFGQIEIFLRLRRMGDKRIIGVPNAHGPYFLPELFPELSVLKEHFLEIREEALERMKESGTDGPVRPCTLYHGSNSKEVSDFLEEVVRTQKWTAALQYGQTKEQTSWYNFPLILDGHPIATTCPKTVGLLLDALGDRCRVAGFSWLRPRGQISPHTDLVGVVYGALTYHLGLLVPEEGAVLTVKGLDMMEAEGKEILFDASYNHFAANNSDLERVILYLDFKTDYQPPEKNVIFVEKNNSE